MKLIIAGSRSLNPYPTLISSLLRMFNINSTPNEIVSGKAQGVDYSGELYSKQYKIKLKEFPANWEEFGKSAGPKRNAEMAEYGDALLLIWDGESKGSKNMKENMLKLEKPIYEVILRSCNV